MHRQTDKLPASNARVGLITGASRGIGRATALSLAQKGVDIAALARTGPALDSLQSEVLAHGVRFFSQCVDVACGDQLEQAIGEIEKNLGPVSILINCAGMYATDPVKDHSLDLWRNVLETNLTSALRASKRVLGAMIESKWGRIVNVSSISGKQGEPYGAAYSASKFGLLGLTQSLALEVARHGITVNAVCPGWVKTEMAMSQLNDPYWQSLNDIDSTHSLEIARLSVPMERFIEAEEVAALICFLSDDNAAAITGQAINICGGLSLH